MVHNKADFSLTPVLIACLALFALTGCVERKLTINTQPQGAIVWLNDEEIGFSPVTVEFSWYGDYKVRAEKDGYDILSTHRKLKAPYYDGFPFDFFAETLWPGQIRDYYEWSFELAPYTPANRPNLIMAAQKMKNEAKEEFAAEPSTDLNE